MALPLIVLKALSKMITKWIDFRMVCNTIFLQLWLYYVLQVNLSLDGSLSDDMEKVEQVEQVEREATLQVIYYTPTPPLPSQSPPPLTPLPPQPSPPPPH